MVVVVVVVVIEATFGTVCLALQGGDVIVNATADVDLPGHYYYYDYPRCGVMTQQR